MDCELSIEIDAPPKVVWDVMTDVERWPEWTASVSSLRRIDPGPLAVGTRVRIEQPGFPATTWRVVEVEEGRSFTWTTEAPGLRALARHDVDARKGGAVATLSLRHRGWLGRLVGRLTRRTTERYVGYEAEGLKRRSEEVAADRP